MSAAYLPSYSTLISGTAVSNQEVTPDAFVKGNLNYKVWGFWDC